MADAGPEQSGEDSDCDGPDRVVREWISVLLDDGVCLRWIRRNLGILTRKERKMIDSGLEQLVRHDETLWSSIRGRCPSLPSGCRVFLMVLFSNTFFFLDSLRVTWMFL